MSRTESPGEGWDDGPYSRELAAFVAGRHAVAAGDVRRLARDWEVAALARYTSAADTAPERAAWMAFLAAAGTAQRGR